MDIKVGQVYKTLITKQNKFIPNQELEILKIYKDTIYYRYLSDNWKTSKYAKDFTSNNLKLQLKYNTRLWKVLND